MLFKLYLLRTVPRIAETDDLVGDNPGPFTELCNLD